MSEPQQHKLLLVSPNVEGTNKHKPAPSTASNTVPLSPQNLVQKLSTVPLSASLFLSPTAPVSPLKRPAPSPSKTLPQDFLSAPSPAKKRKLNEQDTRVTAQRPPTVPQANTLQVVAPVTSTGKGCSCKKTARYIVLTDFIF